MNSMKYWRSHAIEAVVIVGSILLAFAIDAAWESRNENIREKQLLNFIYADMESNMDEINLTIEWNLQQSTGLYNFMNATPESLSHLTDNSSAMDFLQVTIPSIGALYAVSVFTPYKGSLVDSDLSEIQSAELRNELGAWLGLSDGITLTAPRNIEASVTLRTIASKHGTATLETQYSGLLPKVLPEGTLQYGEVLEALREDEEFISSLLLYHAQRIGTFSRLEPLKEATERVMLLLQENM